MKAINSIRLKMMAFALICSATLSANAQEAITLQIGDPAPPIKYSKWLKGSPVELSQKNRLYVLEFWATWCGPCIAAMPELTKLAKEYEDKATFIGVDVFEKPKDDKPYETTLPEVVKFVEKNKHNMGYNIIADNSKQEMGKKWLHAAGLWAIPATFVVKNNRIIWTGHPMALDSMMPLFLSGKYDMEAFKKSQASKKNPYTMGNQLVGITTPILDTMKAKNYKTALEMTNRAIQNNEVMARTLKRYKFLNLLRIDEAEAIKFAEQWMKDDKSVGSVIPNDIAAVDKLSKTTYLFAVKPMEDFIATLKPPVNPRAYTMLASIYAKAGDYEKAISNQQTAIDAAKAAPPKSKGQIETGESIEDMEKKLSEYKNVAQQ